MSDTHNSTNTRLQSGDGFPAENPDSSPALVGMSDYTRQLLRDRAEKRNETVLGGNLADLQRMGEMLAGGPGTSTNLSSAFAAPPGVDPKSDTVVTAPQAAAAKGEYDRETVRTGLLDAPPAPTPPENKDATSVDPTSVSPTVESKGGASTPSTPKKA